MICSRHIALSFVALSVIVIYAIIRRKNASKLKKKAGGRHMKADLEAEIKDRKDMISQLPDDLLIPIVKHLSTREVVRTSILSKRWRNLYEIVPHIKFDCLHMFGSEQLGPLHYDDGREENNIIDGLLSYFRYNTNPTSALQKKFINGLDTFLGRYSGSRIISCNLACCFSAFYPNKLEQWIFSLARFEVEQFSLKFECSISNHPITSKSSNFSFQLISVLAPSLQFLKLTRCFLQPNLKTQCNKLKILFLDMVTLVPGAMECILANCLNLECLVIVECTVLNSKLSICGPNLQLKDLFIDVCCNLWEIELCAGNLTTFEYFGRELINFHFEHVPLLENFSISLDHENDVRFSYGELGVDLPRLKFLIFQASGKYCQALRDSTLINMFNNLKQLDLGFSMCEPDLLSVASVLDMCPVLQVFHLSKTENCSPPPNLPTTWPLSVHTHLKEVEFSGFSVTKEEIDIARYILRCALVLEKMCFNSYYSFYIGRGNSLKTRAVPWRDGSREIIIQHLEGHSVSGNVEFFFRH